MASNHQLGSLGEHLACTFLEMCGYHCLQRRYRIPGGEIDLVMDTGASVVFVEVKTRGPSSPARPEEFLSRRQLGFLRKAALTWLATGGRHPDRTFRFDLVAVEYQGEDRGLLLRHYRNIG